jgi:hypothetical protein
MKRTENNVSPRISDSDYIPGFGWEVDLSKENCTPELWEALGGDGKELTDEEYERFLKGELI